MECPICGENIPVRNVGVCIDESGEPFVRCHGCRRLLRVELVDASHEDDNDSEFVVFDRALRHGPPKA
jgi:hypothetical protein